MTVFTHSLQKITLAILAGIACTITGGSAEQQDRASLNEQGFKALAAGQVAEAEQHFDAAVRADLAKTLLLVARYRPTESLLKRCLAIQEKNLGKDHVDVARTLGLLANLYVSEQREAEAEGAMTRQLAIMEQRLGPENSETSQVLRSLAQWLVGHSKYADAERLYKREIDIQQRNPAHREIVIESGVRLGEIYIEQGKHADAEQWLKAIMDDVEQNPDPDGFAAGASRLLMAGLLQSQGRYAEAAKLARRGSRLSLR